MNERIDMKNLRLEHDAGRRIRAEFSISGAGKVQGGSSNVRKCTAPGCIECCRAMWTAQASCAQAESREGGRKTCPLRQSDVLRLVFPAQSVQVEGARVRLRFTADGAGAHGRPAPCVRLSGGRQRPLLGRSSFSRRVPGQRRRRGRDGGLERCSRDRASP